ncbi:MAG: hypothetical protein PHG95_03515 [Patescibacteria group bacterium]|nr:hypothetical protein [Patescibacteria group bacterium]
MDKNFWRTTIKLSHILAEPEFREIFQPHQEVVINPETITIESCNPLLVIVTIEVSGGQLPIDLAALQLSQEQKERLKEFLPKNYFKKVKRLSLQTIPVFELSGGVFLETRSLETDPAQGVDINLRQRRLKSIGVRVLCF